MTTTISGLSIGVMGRDALQPGREGKVMGVTSSGAFLRVDDNIVFLTSLPYLSPYNLQVASVDVLLQLLKPGTAFLVSQEQISFPSIDVQVAINRLRVWVPGEPVTLETEPEQQGQIIRRILHQIQALEGDKGFLFLVENHAHILDAHQKTIAEAAQGVSQSFRDKDLSGILKPINSLLGAGGGLTPSGDDFLTGFYLYHVRRAQSLHVHSEWVLNALDEVIRCAWNNTTTISVNRLLAARNGWSEEVFLSLLDHLFAPELVTLPPNLTQILLNFGHSSGVDTLVGIYFAISSLQPE